MNQVEFNLLDEPWIRVRDAACRVQEVSLADALLRAQEFTDLAGEMPTQDAAMLRLLLAVDLYLLQSPESAAHVRLHWGENFYFTQPEENAKEPDRTAQEKEN